MATAAAPQSIPDDFGVDYDASSPFGLTDERLARLLACSFVGLIVALYVLAKLIWAA